MLGGREKMVEGRLGKIAKELALLEQPFIKDNTKTVGEHIKEAVAAIGENIQVRPRAYAPRVSKYKRDAILRTKAFMHIQAWCHACAQHGGRPDVRAHESSELSAGR